jgi:hypothetical protein
LTTTFSNESIYWHGIGKISNFLNKLLHEVFGWALAKILMIFCKVNIFALLEELPQLFIPYFIME